MARRIRHSSSRSATAMAFAALQDPHGRLRHREKRAPEIVHGVAVEASRTPQQLGWIDHVRRGRARGRKPQSPGSRRAVSLRLRRDPDECASAAARAGPPTPMPASASEARRVSRHDVGPGSTSATPPGLWRIAVAMMRGRPRCIRSVYVMPRAIVSMRRRDCTMTAARIPARLTCRKLSQYAGCDSPAGPSPGRQP